jgi:predicted RNase H-like HicB family nuclease
MGKPTSKDGVTDAMIEAGAGKIGGGSTFDHVERREMAEEIYLAMLRASPPVSTDAETLRAALQIANAALDAAAATLADRDATIERIREALKGVEPHLDAIICYASTMGEHEPNRIAYNVRAALDASATGMVK